MNVKHIKHSPLLGKKIRKIAVLGGSGSFAIEEAICQKADCYVTSDLKYHDYFKAEKKIILADIGHYESEHFTKQLILDFLNKKIPKFACIISKTKTNPVNHF
jgi:putative NIF3 family GTP cyclohydrolase 1 type 2